MHSGGGGGNPNLRCLITKAELTEEEAPDEPRLVGRFACKRAHLTGCVGHHVADPFLWREISGGFNILCGILFIVHLFLWNSFARQEVVNMLN